MSYFAKKVGRRVAGQRLAEYEPEDPHYEEYTDAKGRKRQRKRAMPAGLNKRDERVLRSVRRRAHYLDKGFSLCGFRFGWTAILGLIPGAGDIAQFLLGFMLVLRKCREAEIPATLQQRMLFNQLAGLGIGLIPLLGDIALAVFKANSRNAALLEEFLIRRASSSTGGTSSIEADEQAAQSAIANSKIERRTGEMTQAGAPVSGVGTATTAGASTTGGTQSGEVAAARAAEGKRGYYGWGGGGGGKDAGATTTVTAPPASAATRR